MHVCLAIHRHFLAIAWAQNMGWLLAIAWTHDMGCLLAIAWS
jgi:hypothetical protein